MDDLAGLTAPRQFNQADHIASPRGIFGIGPAVALVLDIPKGVESFLVARRRDVEAASAGQLHPRRHEVEFNAVLMGVSYPQDIPLIPFQTGECQALEGIHDLGLLALGWRVLSCERQDAGTVGPLMAASVDLSFD